MTDNSKTATDFSAADATLGYLFQCRLALLTVLRRVRTGDEFFIFVETLDDIVIEEQGKPPSLFQVKHHMRHAANLTDGSPDLWKTLRIWCEGTTKGSIPPLASLYLLTTSASSDSSAASYLCVSGKHRDPLRAADLLRNTALTSTNQANEPGYTAFRTMTKGSQEQLLSRVFVVDASPNVVELEAELQEEVRWATNPGHVVPFLHRLEGWWLQRVVHQLAGMTSAPLLSDEVESEMDDLREQFKQDALPIDEDILALEIDDSVYQDAVFVRQLQLIDIGARRILWAVREYLRAFEQRSRWVREDLLLVGELDKYERRLVEEWEIVFERMRDEIGTNQAEEAKKKVARDIYKWAEERIIPIRRNVTEPFVTRGSYHMLSNDLRVGWHPEFLDRLKHLLTKQEAVK
jgi:hypothetical protein